MLTCFYNTTDSTSTRASHLARLNPQRRVLVAADVQTAGRGRTGRAWQSPRGGAWFSLVWPATGMHPMHLRPAPLIVGIAIHDTLSNLLDDQAAALKIKWPNDLLLYGRKVAGILCEQTLHPDNPDDTNIIIGVGINANLDTHRLGNDLRHPAISLSDVLDRPVNIRELIQQCAANMTQRMAELTRHGLHDALRRRINQRLAWRGKNVCLTTGPHQRQGEVLGIDAAGRLVLQTRHGLDAYDAGEVQMIRPKQFAICNG